MTKTPETDLVEDIKHDFHTYLRKGARLDRVIGSAHPNLDIDDIETLLRIHFVLTDAEGGDNPDAVGVLDFMRKLEDRIRRMKTTTTPNSIELRGELRGHIDRQQTLKRRLRAGRIDEPIFVCNLPEENYDTDENLVLKQLLSNIYGVVFEDLKPALENPDGYKWLKPWLESPADGTKKEPESTAEYLKRIYERNVYLQRINVANVNLTDRTIESVKRSRSQFYHEAAVLLDRYRQLMNQQLGSEEARDILDNTLVAPEKTEVLFELYWVFRVLDSYDAVEYRVLTDWGDSPSTIATWEQGNSYFVLSHDSIGEGLTFGESIDTEEVKESEVMESSSYLSRMNTVINRWQELSSELLDYSAGDSLWGGRPDIVLERYEREDNGDRTVEEVFIGEVKYSRDINYIASGLRELLEYMAFARRATGDEGGYLEADNEVLDSVSVKGLLFADNLDRETARSGDIEIIQYNNQESLDRVL